MFAQELAQTATALVARGKGILAIDESLGTIKKRFDGIAVENTEENRRAYRELLIHGAGIGEHISGMILFDETLRQKTATGIPFAEALVQGGMIPGIKVDQGTKDLPLHPGEKITEGLDGLGERLKAYHDLGARFAKWRAVIAIDTGSPSRACILANAQALARYAALCQENGLVPIVEPEVLMDGANDIARCHEVTVTTLRALFNALAEQDVVLEHLLLKTNMVVSGKLCPQQAGVAEVAERTLHCLRNTVPGAVAGIVFLSGGQSAEAATEHLNAMNATNAMNALPWPLSFSYGRALQDPVLKTWAGQPGNRAAAQRQLLLRARFNGLASLGQYKKDMERELAA
jgi:fructose-bisphosphate aldolase class I